MYKNILLPTDGSALSAKAVEAGLQLAKSVGARVTALVAYEPFHVFSLSGDQLEYTPATYAEHATAEGRKILEAVAAQAADMLVTCSTEVRQAEQPYKAIIEAAEVNGCDLVVMGSHGRRGMAALVLGSVTVEVLTHSTIPVLVYR
jgi:nucleotide-binding universal stress UspA family protein